MYRVLIVELRKLNRSLAAALAVAAPGLIAVFTFFNTLRIGTAQPWDMWMVGATGIWAFFMLPMSVTALTALVAHMEHGPRTWDHLRALPLPRWTIYAAKALSVFLVLALMSLGVFVLTWAAVKLAVVLKPQLAPTGVFDASAYLTTLGRMYLAATLVVVIQLWIALRWSSFVPGLVVGIGGTFFAVVATSARVGVFLPWQMPVNMLATDGWRTQTALGLGFGGGLVLLVLMLWHLSRREVL